MKWGIPAALLLDLILTGGSSSLLGATVGGVLVPSNTAVCADAGLIFINESTQQVFPAETGPEGEFQVELAAGEYSVYRQCHDQREFVTRLTVDERGAKSLQLQVGAEESPADELRAIGDFTVGNIPSGDKNMADLINPFPAKKQGRLYGAVYLFHRNDNLDARNFFDPVGEPLPEYKRNQFGGNLGFYVTPQLSLYGSYDGLRIIQGSTILTHVPTAAMKSGDFLESGIELVDPETGEPFPGNAIPADRFNPVSQKVLLTIPDPNRTDPDRNFVNNDPLLQNRNNLNIRSDYETSKNATVVGEYYYTGVERTRVNPLPAFGSAAAERHQAASVAYNRAITDQFIAYSRIELARSRTSSLSRNALQDGLLSSLGIKGLTLDDPVEEGYPGFDLTGYADPGDVNSPTTAVRNRASIDSSATYVINNHTLRGGIGLDQIQLNNYRSDGLHRGSFSFTGKFTGDGFADFLLGLPDSASRGIGSDRADLRKFQWNAFLRDQWRINPVFQITTGISYRFSPPYRSIRDNVSGFFPLLFEPPADGEIVIAGTERARELGFGGAVDGTLIFPDRNDWAPSLAFAYNPLGSNQLVLRGTYSINYDSPDQWYFIESLGRNYPFYYIESVETSEGGSVVTLDDPFSESASPEMTVRGISPDLRSAYIQNWRASVETELSRNWSLEITYAGQKGTRMTRVIPGNVPTPAAAPIQDRRSNPEFGRFQIVNNGGNFVGNGLDVAAERRMADGLSLRSGFEWNRFFSDDLGGDPQNPRNLKAERSQMSWVPRKRFFLNYIIELPFRSLSFADDVSWLQWALDGWRLSGITEIQDGRPFTVTVTGDPNNDGVYGDRPDRIGSGSLSASQRSVDQWFDTSAFVAPAPYSFGTSGRGILLGPGHHTWDVSVIKQTRMSDGEMLEFRVEFFNALNHTNFYRPTSQLDSSTFGTIFGADRAREIEVALKYSF